MVNSIHFFAHLVPVRFAHAQMRLCQIARDRMEVGQITILPALEALHIIDHTSQRLFRGGGAGMAIDLNALFAALLNQCADEISAQKPGRTGEEYRPAVLWPVGILSLRGNFLRQDTFRPQIGLEFLFPAGQQGAEIIGNAGNGGFRRNAADIDIDTKIMFQVTDQFHHAQGIAAQLQEAVLRAEGYPWQHLPENSGDDGLDLFRGGIGRQRNLLARGRFALLGGGCSSALAAAAVQYRELAGFIHGAGRQGFNLAVIGAGQGAGGHKYNIPERKIEVAGGQAVYFGCHRGKIRTGGTFRTQNGAFALHGLHRKYRHGIGRERNALLPQQQGNIPGENIFAADDNHFLDAAGEVKLPFIHHTHIAGAVELPPVAGNNGLEPLGFLRVLPVAGAYTAALDADFSNLAGLAGGAIGPDGHQYHIPCRTAHAHNGLFPLRRREESSLPVGFQIDMLAAVIPAGQRANADTLRKAIARCKAIGGNAKQRTEFFHGRSIYKFGTINQMGHVGKIVFFGFLRRNQPGADLIGGIGRGGDVHLVIGKHPQPHRRPGQKLQRRDKIRNAGISNNG